MSDRITNQNLLEVCHNLNRRLKEGGSSAQVCWQGRNGYIGLDEFDPETGAVRRTLTTGTKREVYDAVWNMIRGIDLLKG